MKLKTTQVFAAVVSALAVNYGVASVSEQFSVEPTIEQTLYDQVYQSAEFCNGQLKSDTFLSSFS
ncbi:P2 family phage major capsid protein [Moritella yayanosii]|uniref:Uncharacterized protein n=1 Tax=Moritella yayanosii TaxID=69539 RepID=A0A330LLX5_9GAMM|nr:P2 family phage major capsid protein [Moritella yayanosii]SQD77830.1 exported protein of unknown function, might belong to Prophage PSPPH06, major capsid protein, P2 family [Moritella yayanosii]